MNFVAGCLLLFMDEEDAFWCLTVIVEKLLPGYFDTTMAASQVWLKSKHVELFALYYDAMQKRLMPIVSKRPISSLQYL